MKKMGIVLIVIGIAIALTGLVMVAHQSENKETVVDVATPRNDYAVGKTVESVPVSHPVPVAKSHMKSDSEQDPHNDAPDTEPLKEKEEEKTLRDSKEVGNAFENFVANFFTDRSTFKVLEWNQGTTSSQGVYAEHDKNPDFRINQSFRKSGLEYWVECKYRSRNEDGHILIKKYQLNRYRSIQRSSHIKIFVAIGVGGKPGNPDELYIVPLDSIKDEATMLDDIGRFKVSKNGKAFADYIRNYFENHVFKKTPM